MQPNIENLTPDDDNTPGRFTDKRTDERIRELLTNEKDTISADDIKNVQSNISSPSGEVKTDEDDEKVIDNTKDGDEFIGKDDNDKDKPEDITPWNVID